MKNFIPTYCILALSFALQTSFAMPAFACDEHENDDLIPLETKIDFLAGKWTQGEILGVDCSENLPSGFGFRTTSPEGASKDYSVNISFPLCDRLFAHQDLAREQGVEDIFTTRIYVMSQEAGAVGFDAFLADHKAVLDPALSESERAEILSKH